MASFEERVYELGVAELAEQERHLGELRSRPTTLLAAGALVPSLLAHTIFGGAAVRGASLVCLAVGAVGGIGLLAAIVLILIPYRMAFSLDASFTYRWLFRENALEQPGVDLVLADALHERRQANQQVINCLSRYLFVAIGALALEAAGFAAARR